MGGGPGGRRIETIADAQETAEKTPLAVGLMPSTLPSWPAAMSTPMSGVEIATNMPHIRYSAERNDWAPRVMASYSSCRRSVWFHACRMHETRRVR